MSILRLLSQNSVGKRLMSSADVRPAAAFGGCDGRTIGGRVCVSWHLASGMLALERRRSLFPAQLEQILFNLGHILRP